MQSIMADDTNGVTITIVPEVTAGILNFALTYTSDTKIDMSWDYGAGTDQIMIRGKYGEYPADISDPTETPSDGYEVYQGDATSASDTVVNLDFPDSSNISDTSDTPFTVFYKAWGRNEDGTWQTVTSTGNEESKELAALNATLQLFLPVVLLIAINALAFWTNKRFLYVVAALIDIIYGLVYAISTTIPSIPFYVGMAIVVIGLYCFIDRFVMRTWGK
jgi:hypothetical protein